MDLPPQSIQRWTRSLACRCLEHLEGGRRLLPVLNGADQVKEPCFTIAHNGPRLPSASASAIPTSLDRSIDGERGGRTRAASSGRMKCIDLLDELAAKPLRLPELRMNRR
jgi:hypothetical protein